MAPAAPQMLARQNGDRKIETVVEPIENKSVSSDANERAVETLADENETLRTKLAEAEKNFTRDVSRLTGALAVRPAPAVGDEMRDDTVLERTATRLLELEDRHADEVARLEEALTQEKAGLLEVGNRRDDLQKKLSRLRASRRQTLKKHKRVLKEHKKLKSRLEAFARTRVWRLLAVPFGGRRARALAKSMQIGTRRGKRKDPGSDAVAGRSKPQKARSAKTGSKDAT